jgi:hypothetical protein
VYRFSPICRSFGGIDVAQKIKPFAICLLHWQAILSGLTHGLKLEFLDSTTVAAHCSHRGLLRVLGQC